jgi:hypothetical protein
MGNPSCSGTKETRVCTASLTGLNSTPDDKWYVYQYDQTLNDLYLADGLR